MIERRVEHVVKQFLGQFPVVAILGPRQVGKTTLARDIVGSRDCGDVYLDLERPEHRARLQDADRYLRELRGHLVVLDEIHRVPEIFGVMRGIVDDRRRNGDRSGHFLVLGSASIDLQRQTSESLAGRMASVELAPILETELPAGVAVDRLWLRGGFPDSLLAADDTSSIEWRRQFIRTYLERDIPMLGPRIPAETLRRLWTMLAHQQGSTMNMAALASGLGISGQTVARYVDLLVDLLLVRRVEPVAANVGKRLVRSPRVYVRDSGIVHALLGLDSIDALLGHPVAGGSWEGFVVEQLVAAASATGASVGYYRTARGAEVDIVIEFARGQRWAIEIKRSSAPTPTRGFHVACDDLAADRRIVVHGGTESFPIGRGVDAMSVRNAVAALSLHDRATRRPGHQANPPNEPPPVALPP